MGNDVMERAKCGPEHGNPNNPHAAQIDVFLTKGCPNPQFHLTSPTLPENPPGSGNFDFLNDHRPGFNIRFILHDQTNGGAGSGYVFAPVPDDACWSRWGSNSCPTAPAYDVFCPRAVAGTTLDVYNDNPTPAGGAFRYTLRVTKTGGAPYCDLDPGGTDNNGPRL